MNWKFWKKSEPGAGEPVQAPKLDKPRELPEPVGRKMVVGLKMEPDMVWSLKYVSRPVADRKKTHEFRIFSPVTVNQAGVVVKNYTSLDDRPELVMFKGVYDKNASSVDIDAA